MEVNKDQVQEEPFKYKRCESHDAGGWDDGVCPRNLDHSAYFLFS